SEPFVAATNKDGQNSSPQQNIDRSEAAAFEPAQALQTVKSKSETTDWPSTARRWALIIYAPIASLLLLRLVGSFVYLQRVKRKAVQVDSLPGGIRVLEANVVVPMAVGFGQPCVVLPRGFRQTLNSTELHDVLLHEAEHLRRRDHWKLLAQSVAAAVYW